MKHELKRKPDVQKTTMLAIVVNAVQIGVLFAFVLYVLTAGPEARNSWSLQFMVIAGALPGARAWTFRTRCAPAGWSAPSANCRRPMNRWTRST